MRENESEFYRKKFFYVDWINLAQNKDKLLLFVYALVKFQVA